MAEEYVELTGHIMVDTFGIGWDDYYQPDCLLPGFQLMSYLVQSDQEGRAPLAEECARHVPVSLPERVGNGFPLEELRRLLAGTRFEGLAGWGAIWCHDTGLYFLDTTHEDAWNDCIDWCRENVESLTEDWQRSEIIINRVNDLADWLEQDPPRHFAELLEFMEQRRRDAQGA